MASIRLKGKVAISEGLWFAVPLRDGGYAAGVAVRVSRGSGTRIVFGYFFGERYSEVPLLRECESQLPSQSILRERFSGRALQSGAWPIIGIAQAWTREKWVFPPLVRRDAVSGEVLKVRYDDSDPSKILSEKPCTQQDAVGLPRDGLSGDGAVELLLTALINRQPVTGQPVSSLH
jgi:hypothetical protein